MCVYFVPIFNAWVPKVLVSSSSVDPGKRWLASG